MADAWKRFGTTRLRSCRSWEEQDTFAASTAAPRIGQVVAFPAWDCKTGAPKRLAGYFVAKVLSKTMVQFYVQRSLLVFDISEEVLVCNVNCDGAIPLEAHQTGSSATLTASVQTQIAQFAESMSAHADWSVLNDNTKTPSSKKRQRVLDDVSDAEAEPAVLEPVMMEPVMKKPEMEPIPPSSCMPICVSAEMPGGFECWTDVDVQIAHVNTILFTKTHRGYCGTLAVAVPAAVTGGRGYIIGVLGDCGASVSVCTPSTEGYFSAVPGLRLTIPLHFQSCVLPLIRSVVYLDGSVRLLQAFSACLDTHVCMEMEETQYPSAARMNSIEKFGQNFPIAVLAETQLQSCRNAIVLDSHGFCTSREIMARCSMARVVVPNISGDVRGMKEEVPEKVTLLPGVTLLQAITDWDVEAYGTLDIVVADTCSNFRKHGELAGSIACAFPKLSDTAIFTITVSTRNGTAGPKVDTAKQEIWDAVAFHAEQCGFEIDMKNTKVAPPYKNMLFSIFFLRRKI